MPRWTEGRYDGLKWAQIYRCLLYDDSFPSSEGITVLGTDISEHKRYQEALKRSEQKRLRRFYESGLIHVFIGTWSER